MGLSASYLHILMNGNGANGVSGANNTNSTTGAAGSTGASTNDVDSEIQKKFDELLTSVQIELDKVNKEIAHLTLFLLEMKVPNDDKESPEYKQAIADYDKKQQEIRDKLAKLNDQKAKIQEAIDKIKQAKDTAKGLNSVDAQKLLDSVTEQVIPTNQAKASDRSGGGMTSFDILAHMNSNLSTLKDRANNIQRELDHVKNEIQRLSQKRLEIMNKVNTCQEVLYNIAEKWSNPGEQLNPNNFTKIGDDGIVVIDEQAYQAKVNEYKQDQKYAEALQFELEQLQKEDEKCQQDLMKLEDTYSELEGLLEMIQVRIQELTEEMENAKHYDEELADFINNKLEGKQFDSMEDFENFCGKYFVDLKIEEVSEGSYNVSNADAKASAAVTIGNKDKEQVTEKNVSNEKAYATEEITDVEKIRARIAEIKDRLAQINARISALEKQINATANSAARLNLNVQIKSLMAEKFKLEQELVALTIKLEANEGFKTFNG